MMSGNGETEGSALWVTVKDTVSRRKFLSGGVAAAGVGAVGAAYLFNAETDPVQLVLRNAEADAVEDIGDGFVLVNGWILSADEVRTERK